jgi:predicted transcriptional regulator of viral defense system
MSTKIVYLGPMETKLLYTLEAQDRLIFTIADAKAILGSSDSSVKNVIYGLKKKNRLKEIERGKYLLSPAKAGLEGYWSEHVFRILPHLIDRYYVSYWSALSHWDMTEQIPFVVYVAIQKRKKNLRFDGQVIHFVTVSPQKFFGYTQEKIGDRNFNIASREKTILDCLDRLEYAGGITEVAKGLWNARNELRFDTLLEYTRRYQVESVQRRLGFLLDLIGVHDIKTERALTKDFKGYHWLDYSARKEILSYDKKWGLKINVPEQELLAFRREL